MFDAGSDNYCQWNGKFHLWNVKFAVRKVKFDVRKLIFHMRKLMFDVRELMFRLRGLIFHAVLHMFQLLPPPSRPLSLPCFRMLRLPRRE
jgi:hypothetical protein